VATAGAGKPALDSSGSANPAERSPTAAGPAGSGSAPVSRGYREEMEHFAYCIRMWDQGLSRQDRPLPRCHGRVAMADAIIALTSNLAMHRRQRIEFKPEWFDAGSTEVPDAEMKPELITA
jgi:hypothetical protein